MKLHASVAYTPHTRAGYSRGHGRENRRGGGARPPVPPSRCTGTGAPTPASPRESPRARPRPPAAQHAPRIRGGAAVKHLRSHPRPTEARCGAEAARSRGGAPPPSRTRTKWTRRVHHPVLIGHAASLSQVAHLAKQRGAPRLELVLEALAERRDLRMKPMSAHEAHVSAKPAHPFAPRPARRGHTPLAARSRTHERDAACPISTG
jgi:hypothetical protein